MYSKLLVLIFVPVLLIQNTFSVKKSSENYLKCLPDEYAACDEYVYFMENSKFGFMDAAGKTVIPAKFITAHNFYEGLASVSVDGNSYGFIDKTGKFVIQPKYSYADDFSDGVSYVWTMQGKKKSSFLINKEGQTFPIPNTKYHGRFSEGLCRFESAEGKYGFIDKTGKFIIPPIYNNVGEFHEGLANVTFDKLSGFIDKTGKILIEPQFSTNGFMNFSGGFTAVRYKKERENGLYQIGFINNKGELQDTKWLKKLDETVTYSIYAISNLSDGLSVLSTGSDENMWAVIDMLGNIIMDFKHFELLYDFQNGMAAFEEIHPEHQGLWGFINTKGETAIKPQFKNVGGFMKNGLAWVSLSVDKKVYEGYINKSGTVIRKWFVYNE